VTWSTIRAVALPVLASLLFAACASTPEEDVAEKPDLGRGVIEGSKAVGNAMKNGAIAFGKGMGTAYEGVRNGFQEPEDEAAFGPYPKGYVDAVRKHFFRVMRYPDDTRFVLGRPEKGFMNRGLLRGGGVAWQGWLVDVDVETVQLLTKHRAARRYVVRVHSGEIIEVHKDATLLRRVEQHPAKQAR
jgi:hypothetical protein